MNAPRRVALEAMTPPEFKVDLDKLPPLPGLSMESMRATPQLDLPERNIERSR